MTTLLDIKALQDQAKAEIRDEVSKEAVSKLKELYRRREKAELVVKNITREIDSYLADVADNVTYREAGVDVE